MASKKKTEKKKVPPLRAGAKAPGKKKPFRLEVGKTYETRDGKYVAKITGRMKDGRFDGEWTRKRPSGFVAWDIWERDGKWGTVLNKPAYNLVRAVKQVKKG